MICKTMMMLSLGPWQGDTYDGPPSADGWRPTSIGYIDSEDLPVRCHWEYAEDEDRCPDVLTYAAEAWANQVDDIGFAEPLGDSDGLFDIYISDDGTAGGAYVDGSYTDEISGDGRTACWAYMALDPGIRDSEMASYVAHEFQHATQMATDYNEPTYIIWEGVASAAQTWTYPDGDVYPEYWMDFQASPWMGILGDGYFLWDEYNLYSFYEYGAEVWVQHLDHTWGDGLGSGAAALWLAAIQEQPVNEPDVLDALGTMSGGDWQDAVMEFSAERLVLGTEAAEGWAEDMQAARLFVAVEDSADFGDLPLSVTPEVAPYETGAIYVAVTGWDTEEPVAVSVESDADIEWGLVVFDGVEAQWSRGTSDEFEVSSDSIVVGVVNLGGPDFDGDDSLRQADLTLSVRTAGEEDTADDDDGEADDEEDKKGCGCASGAAGGAWLPLLVAAFVRRRRG